MRLDPTTAPCYVLLPVLAVMITIYQTKYQAQQQHKFLFILIYSSRTVQLQSGSKSYDNTLIC